VIYLDTQLFRAVKDNTVFLVFGLISGFVFVLAFIYAFPLSARYENSLAHTLKNSMDISVKFFLRTLFLVLILALEIMIFMLSYTTMIIGILVGPACLMLTVSGFAMKFFMAIESPN
jgi:uncharacterized membrane protein YesL